MNIYILVIFFKNFREMILSNDAYGCYFAIGGWRWNETRVRL